MRRLSNVNYYSVLGVPTSATRDQIRTAYRALVREAHPDRGGDPEQFARISEAWEVLGRESERDYYDADRRLKARASRRYTPPIERDPHTGNWASAPDPGTTKTEDHAPFKPPGDGLTDSQRWRRDKRRL